MLWNASKWVIPARIGHSSSHITFQQIYGRFIPETWNLSNFAYLFQFWADGSQKPVKTGLFRRIFWPSHEPNVFLLRIEKWIKLQKHFFVILAKTFDMRAFLFWDLKNRQNEQNGRLFMIEKLIGLHVATNWSIDGNKYTGSAPNDFVYNFFYCFYMIGGNLAFLYLHSSEYLIFLS